MSRVRIPDSAPVLVNVVQLVERQIVVLVVVGSSPIIHPMKGYRQAVRHHTLTVVFVGSNPAIPARFTSSVGRALDF